MTPTDRYLQTRISRRLIPTCDMWYPNYAWLSSSANTLIDAKRRPLGDVQWSDLFSCVDEGGCVEGFVSLQPTYNRPTWHIRTAFWGADDTGVCRDREVTDYDEAVALYEHLVRWLNNLIVVERDALFALGFNWD